MNITAEAIKYTIPKKTASIKASKDRTKKDICNAIKDVEDKNATTKKDIAAYCNEIKLEIQKLE